METLSTNHYVQTTSDPDLNKKQRVCVIMNIMKLSVIF